MHQFLRRRSAQEVLFSGLDIVRVLAVNCDQRQPGLQAQSYRLASNSGIPMPTRVPITASVEPAPSRASIALIGPAARTNPIPSIANTPAPPRCPAFRLQHCPSPRLLEPCCSSRNRRRLFVGLSGIGIESFNSGTVAETSARWRLQPVFDRGRDRGP